MRIYAIKDRLLNYWMQPFLGPTHMQVMSSLATMINSPTDNLNAIAQAPHHFELWSLGEIEEDGANITAQQELVCDCAGLVRSGIRKGGEPGTDPGQKTPSGGAGEARGGVQLAGTQDRAPKDAPRPEAL